ncbi:MAG TPA: hypothetical protein VK658_14820 [Chryseolinea sp.]|nr:hypothetical protein [Chryseolinea sp.]
MTAQEVKDFILATLTVPLNLVSTLRTALYKIVDYVSMSTATTVIPDWTSALTFNTNASGDGRYCIHPDTNAKRRIFETKTDGKINNAPPTNPLTIENTWWREVSPSSSAAIPEWAAGVFGPGLIIVFHNHSVDGRGLYVLLVGTRPFTSTNIETEITALQWERMGGSGSGKGVAKTYTNIAGMLADQAAQKTDFFYLVTTATTDPTVGSGWALYQKFASTTATLVTDYRKLSEQESLDVILSSVAPWDPTTAGTVERSLTAEAQNITARVALGSSDSSNSDARTPSEKGLVEMLLAFISGPWTWASLQIFTTGIRLINTTGSQVLETDASKNVVSAAKGSAYNKDFASSAEVIAGTVNNKPAAPDTLAAWWTNLKTLAHTWSLAQTFTIGPTVSDAGVDEAAYFNSSKKLISRTVAQFRTWLGISGVYDAGNVSGSVTINWNNGKQQKCVATGNITSLSYSNAVVGETYVLTIVSNTTLKTIVFAGSNIWGWPSGSSANPALTDPAANGTSPAKAIDIFTFYCWESGVLEVMYAPNIIRKP